MCRQAGPNTDKVLWGILDPPRASYSEQGGTIVQALVSIARENTQCSRPTCLNPVCVCMCV